jgi:ketosteroid isomerase-like protein
MSRQNVEIVQRLLAASADRDTDASLSIMDANIEWQIADMSRTPERFTVTRRSSQWCRMDAQL